MFGYLVQLKYFPIAQNNYTHTLDIPPCPAVVNASCGTTVIVHPGKKNIEALFPSINVMIEV
jgi:hypothetical protein